MGRGGRGLILGGLAILTGAFARKAYDLKVRQIGRGFDAGERSLRRGTFRCDACGGGVSLSAGETVPACPDCGHSQFTKIS
jgi:DNA-directed RNA polymerase subunit RPC12/RpoP